MSAVIKKSSENELHETVKLFDLLEGNARHRRRTSSMLLINELRDGPKPFLDLANALRKKKRKNSSEVFDLVKKLEHVGIIVEERSEKGSLERLTPEGEKLARALAR